MKAIFEQVSRNYHMESHTEEKLEKTQIAVNDWKITGAGGRN
jgi:hypothetical protein